MTNCSKAHTCTFLGGWVLWRFAFILSEDITHLQQPPLKYTINLVVFSTFAKVRKYHLNLIGQHFVPPKGTRSPSPLSFSQARAAISQLPFSMDLPALDTFM